MWPTYVWGFTTFWLVVVALIVIVRIVPLRLKPLAELVLAVVLYTGIALAIPAWVAFLWWVLCIVTFVVALACILLTFVRGIAHMLALVAIGLVVIFVLIDYLVLPLAGYGADWPFWRHLLLWVAIVFLLAALCYVILRIWVAVIVLLALALLLGAVLVGSYQNNWNFGLDLGHHGPATSETPSSTPSATPSVSPSPTPPASPEMVVADPSAVVNGLAVAFSTTVVNVATSDELTYSWDFGDGSDGSDLTEATPSHLYAKPGDYKVEVTVQDSKTSLADTSDAITVTVARPRVIIKTKGLKLNGDSVCHVYTCGGKGGFSAKQLVVGNGKIPNSPREAATDSFVGKTIKNRQMLDMFLHSDQPKAVLAEHRIRHGMRSHGYSEDDINRCLDSSQYWVWVAPTVASQISGTTFPVNGNRVAKVNGFRGVAANDAIWFCVGHDHNIIKEASLRADCMNPEVARVTPIPAGHHPVSIACRVARKCSVPSPRGGCVRNCDHTGHHHHGGCRCVSSTQAAQPVPKPAVQDSSVPATRPHRLTQSASASTGNSDGYDPSSGSGTAQAPSGSVTGSGGTVTGTSGSTQPETCDTAQGCGGAPSGSPTSPPG